MMDYSSMSDAGINKLVANSLSVKPRKTICFISYQESEDIFPDYCNNPADVWPIITKHRISLVAPMSYDSTQDWMAYPAHDSDIDPTDTNPLRAAMIVFLMMKDDAVNAQGEKV